MSININLRSLRSLSVNSKLIWEKNTSSDNPEVPDPPETPDDVTIAYSYIYQCEDDTERYWEGHKLNTENGLTFTRNNFSGADYFRLVIGAWDDVLATQPNKMIYAPIKHEFIIEAKNTTINVPCYEYYFYNNTKEPIIRETIIPLTIQASDNSIILTGTEYSTDETLTDSNGITTRHWFDCYCTVFSIQKGVAS